MIEFDTDFAPTEKQLGQIFYNGFCLSIKLLVNEKLWYQMAWDKLVNDTNKTITKVQIYNNDRLDQRCLKSKRPLKFKYSTQDEQSTHHQKSIVPLEQAKSQAKKWEICEKATKKATEKAIKKAKKKRRKVKENNKHTEKEIPWSLEIMPKIPPGRKTKILKILPFSTVIKGVIILINIQNQRNQKTNNSLSNLHIRNC